MTDKAEFKTVEVCHMQMAIPETVSAVELFQVSRIMHALSYDHVDSEYYQDARDEGDNLRKVEIKVAFSIKELGPVDLEG